MLLGARLAVWVVHHEAQGNRVPACRGAFFKPKKGTPLYCGEVLKACRCGVATDRSDRYWVPYCVVRMEYGLRKGDERKVYVGLDRKLRYQPMYWDRARAMGVRSSEGGCGYEDKYGACRRKHQLGPEAEVILPRGAGEIHVAARDPNEVPSRLFYPLSLRGCPVLACRFVGSRGVRVAPESQRGVSFVDTNAHAEQREKAVH